MLHRAKAYGELENQVKKMKESGVTSISIEDLEKMMFETSYAQLQNRTNPKDVAKVLSDFVNVMNHDEEAFVHEVTTDHRTLQQSTFKLFIKCMEKWAENYDEERFDLRNEQTVKLSKKIMESIQDEPIPFI